MDKDKNEEEYILKGKFFLINGRIVRDRILSNDKVSLESKKNDMIKRIANIPGREFLYFGNTVIQKEEVVAAKLEISYVTKREEEK